MRKQKSATRQERYTIGELAKRAGVSARTLRYYEDQGMLAPARGANGYRVYGEADARRLAQVLAMRACGLSLAMVRKLLCNPAADAHAALSDHLEELYAQGEALRDAIARTRSALFAIERINGMETKDAFEAFKQQRLCEFEETYGQEARERYGNDVIDASNAQMMAMNRDEWNARELLEESIKVQLRLAMAEGDPNSEAAAELTRMHERWIRMQWPQGAYSPQAHLGLAQGYLADDRFRAYYDTACGEGATDFLVAALNANLKA